MRLSHKVLALTLAVTLGLSALVVLVVRADVTAYEKERAQRTIDAEVASYFTRLDADHRQIARLVRLLMEDPQHRSLLEPLEEGDTFASRQLGEEVLGRIIQNEVGMNGAAPAFHVIVSESGDVLLTTAGGDEVLNSALASEAVAWPYEAVVEDNGLVRRMLWLADRLYLAFGVGLRTQMDLPPSYVYFVGFRVDDAWVRGLIGAKHGAGNVALSAWFLVDGQVVAQADRLFADPGDRRACADTLARTTRLPQGADLDLPLELRVGGERLVGRARLFVPAPGSQGALVVASSLDRALSRLRELERTILLVTAAVLLVGLLACRKLAAMIAGPVEQLTAAAGRVARGDFAVPIQATRRDELGALARSFNQMARGLEQRDLIKDTFGKFVDPSIVEDFLADPTHLKLGGERRMQSILFSDLANFTRLSEQLSPEELVGMLNEYLGGVADIVGGTRGIVDKFIGDAVVAFWGPPLAPQHALSACRAGLRLREQVRQLNDTSGDRGYPPLGVRVGIATGEVLVGNIGSRTKYNYTVIGDAVNLASRLEGINKVYGTGVLICEQTARDLKDVLVVRRVDKVRVAGRGTPVTAYEVLADSEDGDVGRVRQLRDAYEDALDLYALRRWQAARDAFAALLSERPDDGPSRILLERCRRFCADAPPDEWDGVWCIQGK